jgi:AcrR family transcriptional regulator
MSSTESPEATPSRREQHKSRTRSALQEAAVELFALQGYDATTTEQIAEKAGVSPRTFFRYFQSKEAVLFFGAYEFFASFTALYKAQPESLSEVEAMRDSFISLAPVIVRRRDALLLVDRAIASSNTLRGRQYDHQHADRKLLARAVAARRGLVHPDESCIILGIVGQAVFRRAFDVWLGGPSRRDLAEVIAAEFAVLLQAVVAGEE